MAKDTRMIAKTSPGAQGVKFFAFAILFGLLSLSIAPLAQAATTSSSASASFDASKCADPDYANDLFDSGEASAAAHLAQTYGAGEESRFSFIAKPIRDAFGSIKTKYCIGKIHDFLNSLKKLLDGNLVDMILGFILGLLEDLLNAVCALAVSAINTALEMICLPLPKLGMPNFVLPGIDGVSCDGISLADYVRVDYGSGFDFGGGSYMPSDLMSVPLSRMRPRSDYDRSYYLFGE